MIANLVMAEPIDQCQTSRLVRRIEQVDQSDEVVGFQCRAALEAKRVFDATAIFDVSMIRLARTVTNPDHVTGRAVPVARGGIDAGQGFFIAKQKRFVAGVEIRLPQLRIGFRRNANGTHEVHRVRDAAGQRTIALALRAIGNETEHPLIDVLQIGIAALCERAQKVQRSRGLAVGHFLTSRIGNACLSGELRTVDDVAAIDRQLDAVLRFRIGGTRLGELAGDAADLDDRLRRAEGQHHGHLQEYAEEVADIVRAMLGKALGAVTALKQEALAFGDRCELLLELACLTCKYKWRISTKTGLDIAQSLSVRIVRHLLDGFASPGSRCPVLAHYCTCYLLSILVAIVRDYPVTPEGAHIVQLWTVIPASKPSEYSMLRQIALWSLPGSPI